MRYRELRETLRQQTAEVLRHHHAASRSETQPSAPQPGDLFLLSATADLFIEWAVITRHRWATAYLLVVPADTHPLVGSADVVAETNGDTGVLRLRCGFGVWLTAGWLDPSLRSGRVENAALQRAQGQRQALELGTLTQTPGSGEIDDDPAYRQWSRELRRAAQLLLAPLPIGAGFQG